MSVDRKTPGTLNRITMSIEMKEGSSGELFDGAVTPKPTKDGRHNVVVSSLGRGDLHAPVLDLDIPHTLVPSSTPGNAHLYLDVPMSWRSYVKLLLVLAEVGIIEQGYCDASIARGFSAARLPWVTKASEKVATDLEMPGMWEAADVG